MSLLICATRANMTQISHNRRLLLQDPHSHRLLLLALLAGKPQILAIRRQLYRAETISNVRLSKYF